MSRTYPFSPRAAQGLPPSSTPLPRRHGVPAAVVALGCLAAAVALAWPARAVVPPYAEEWSIPASPQDVEVDPFGRIWVSCNDDSIRVYTATGGELLFIFGGRGNGDGQFLDPYGIAFDPTGDAYICDYEGARLEKFTSSGDFLLSWPIPSNRSDHVAIDAAGDVYVTGYDDFSVHKYTATGTPLLDWASNGGSTTAGIVEVGGTVHVVQWDAPTVEQFGTDGTFLGSFETEMEGCTDIEVDADGQLWLAAYSQNVIRILTADGVPVDSFGAPGNGPGEFLGAIGVALGGDGSVYVADEVNGRIQRFGDPVTASSPEGGATGPHAGGPAIRAIAPNPCRTAAQLTYSLPHDGQVQISIMDVRGRIVATLVEGPMAGGLHHTQCAARNAEGRPLAAGMYFVRLAHGGGADIARLTVVR